MPERIKIATIETGGTWGRLGNWLAVGLRGAGFDIELLKRGGEVPETAYRVDGGEADLSVTTTFGARAASRGKLPYSRTLNIRGIAEMQYPVHWFVSMMRLDAGASSFEEMAANKPPLKLCLPGPDMLVSYPVKEIFKLFGIDPYVDIPRWGGEIITSFNEAPALIATGRADGLFRENSPFRYDVCQHAAMRFFQLTETQVRSVSDAIGIKPGIIPAGTYRDQAENVRTLDAEGFTIFSRGDLPEELGYRIARAIDHHTPGHYISTSIFYSPRFAVLTGVPLHAGAARYYREQGYQTEQL